MIESYIYWEKARTAPNTVDTISTQHVMLRHLITSDVI